jgi:hypothetical protein
MMQEAAFVIENQAPATQKNSFAACSEGVFLCCRRWPAFAVV